MGANPPPPRTGGPFEGLRFDGEMESTMTWKSPVHRTTWRAKNRQKQKRFLRKLRGIQGCQECKMHDWRVLEFHHVDPTTKLFSVKNGGSHGWGAIRREVRKCVVLCRNCHCLRHYKEGSKC